jgi:hypothetical protein
LSNSFPAIIRVIVEWKMMEKESNEGNEGAACCRQRRLAVSREEVRPRDTPGSRLLHSTLFVIHERLPVIQTNRWSMVLVPMSLYGIADGNKSLTAMVDLAGGGRELMKF